jgi:hypothetical protein
MGRIVWEKWINSNHIFTEEMAFYDRRIEFTGLQSGGKITSIPGISSNFRSLVITGTLNRIAVTPIKKSAIPSAVLKS